MYLHYLSGNNKSTCFGFALSEHATEGRTDSDCLCWVKITELGKCKATTGGKVDDSGLKADIFSKLACYLKCDTICPFLSPPPWTSLGQAPRAAAFPLTMWPGSNREWGAGLDARGQWLWSSHVPQSCKVRNFKKTAASGVKRPVKEYLTLEFLSFHQYLKCCCILSSTWYCEKHK